MTSVRIECGCNAIAISEIINTTVSASAVQNKKLSSIMDLFMNNPDQGYGDD